MVGSAHAVIVFLLAGFNALFAEEPPVPAHELGLEASVDFASRYIWRGYDITDKKPALHPSITYSPPMVPGLSANFYSSLGFDLPKSGGITGNKWTDIDAYLDYRHELIPSKLEGSVGLLWYEWYSQASSATGADGNARDDFDLKLRLDYTLHRYFKPYLAYYRGLNSDIKGNYSEFGVSSSVTLSKHWSTAPSVQAAFSDQYGLEGKFSFVGLSLPATFRVGHFGLTPYFNFILPLEDLNGEGRRGIPVGGISLSYSF